VDYSSPDAVSSAVFDSYRAFDTVTNGRCTGKDEIHNRHSRRRSPPANGPGALLNDHRSHVVRGTVSRVVVAADNGDVALRSGPVGRVTVAESRHYWWRKPKRELTLRDGVLSVGVDCGGFGPGCSNDLGITVPRGVGAGAHRRRQARIVATAATSR
jgi:hypothetical protein